LRGVAVKNKKEKEKGGREKRGGRSRLGDTQIIKSKIAVTLAQRRHWRCFRSVAKKNRKEKGEGEREKRGGRRREAQIVKFKIAVTPA